MTATMSSARAYWQARDAERDATRNAPHQPLGLSSFGREEQHAFGRSVRLAMAMMEGHEDPPNPLPHKAFPDNPVAIATRLRMLCRESAANLADQLELLVRFDDLEGWRSTGANHCGAWMNQELGISLQLGWEYLRVGRKLRGLPIARALFRAGTLSWSVIRIITRVATPDNEALLCHSALDASVSDVQRLCSEYRWSDDPDDDAGDGDGADDEQGSERRQAMQQFNARAFTWRKASNGNTEFRLALPPDLAEVFLNGIELALSRLNPDVDTSTGTDDKAGTNAGNNADSMQQRRADAAVLMAEIALQSESRGIATADRYQVIINVDADELGNGSTNGAGTETDAGKDAGSTISRRPTIEGHTPIARGTARRHACDCSVSTITQCNGEPVDIGRKSRIWPVAMARAIKARDRHCQFPGCTATRHLQIHHIQHWADGGSTCVDNGVCLCTKHHTLVHEGGYRIERVSDLADGLNSQFRWQSIAPPDAIAAEVALRQSPGSFDQVRKYAPDRFRFRFVDQKHSPVASVGSASGCCATHAAGAWAPDTIDEGAAMSLE